MNVITFKSFLESTLVFCILDTTPGIIDPWIKEVTKNQADQTLQNLFIKGFTILQGTDEDQLLLEAGKHFKYACVVSTGTEFVNGRNCIDALLEECTDDFLIKGHILDRDDAYYELHQQCYLVNLTNYKKYGCPNVGKTSLGEKHTQIAPVRSSENIHDDYTPFWVKQGTTEKTFNHKCHGWNIIRVSLEHFTITAFNDEIRNNKRHLYPESPKDFYNQVNYVYKKERFCSNEFVHTAHTESPPTKLISNIRQVIAPASGDWFMDILDREELCTVILYDYNLQSLNYWKHHVQKLNNIEYKFVYLDLLADTINLDAYIDLSLEDHTLVNLSNIFCYEGTSTLSPVVYRLFKENQAIEYFKKIMPNCLINFTGRASAGFDDITVISDTVTANKIKTYNVKELRCPTWHISSWI